MTETSGRFPAFSARNSSADPLTEVLRRSLTCPALERARFRLQEPFGQ